MRRVDARFVVPAILVAGLLGLLIPGLPSGLAQETQEAPNAAVTQQEWRSKVEDARRRSEEFVARARAGTLEPVQATEDETKAADKRALNDPSLERGDIVSTSKGFYIFNGSGETRRPSDFVPAPDGVVPAARGQRR